MTSHDWQSGHPVFGLFLNGEEIPYKDPRGQRIRDDSFLLLINATPDDATFTLPVRRLGACWEVVLDTADPAAGPEVRYDHRAQVGRMSRSMLVLRRVVVD
jgi:glycogen operon protein